MSLSIRPAGYEYLKSKYQVKAAPHYRISYISNRWDKQVTRVGDNEEHVLPNSYAPDDTLGDQLEFALKYEGLHLDLLAGLFETVDESEVIAAVREKPTGQYRRRIWYLYEFLTGRTLPIPDLNMGSYIPLVDEEFYFVHDRPRRSSRHRVLNNLLGTRSFCPLIRKTERLLQVQRRRLDEEARETVRRYPADLLARAVSYLYTKETKSSFQIEREEPDAKRASRFVELLRLAEKKTFVTREGLIELQNAIVDQRFAAKHYRDFQNYVGESRPFGQELIHFVCPKPTDVPSLMGGLFESYRLMTMAELDPVIIASVISFGFVFIHPFDDGNGRIHRFLIHNILARSGYAPEGVIFPISASMLQQMRKYDETLESFSAPLLPLLDWTLDPDGEMTVRGETARHYRYIDFTTICERLYEFVTDTVERQLPDELNFLTKYDAARRSVRSVVDMPDRLVDLFVKICASNKGRLSKAKRQSLFPMLREEEILRIELGIAAALDGIADLANRLSGDPTDDSDSKID